jgi:primase-polymerase (primpol)-like protein
MQPETRREQCIGYAATLRERFDSGLLAELQGASQWVVWRAELDKHGKKKKVPYNPNSHLAHASVKIPSSWETVQT